MEKQTKPENLFIRRNRALTAVAAFGFFAFGIALAIVFPLAVIKNLPDDDILVDLVVGTSLITFLCLFLGALNARNLFFPFILTADEKGIYNYSGYFHYGFVPWAEIEAFTKGATILDVLDSDTPSIKIFLKDLKSYKKTISFYKKWLLFWSGCNIKVYTMCSQINKRELLGLLDSSLKYYNSPEDGTVENG